MRFWSLCFVLWLGLVAPGCSTNPATGKRQLNIVSQAREISLGDQAEPGFLKSYGGVIPSPAINQYVADLGHELAAVSERPDLPWRFHVVDSSVINAFALPGGKVFITRGLLSKFDNEAQLAGVLGHEIGHVTAQHIGHQMTQAVLVQSAAIGIGIAANKSDRDWLRVLGIGTQVGGTVYLLKFGRDQESQADELGVRYMARLGYNPVGQLQVMHVLEKESAGHGTGHIAAMEMLSTHPLPSTRIKRLDQHIRDHYPRFEDPQAFRFSQDRFRASVLDRLKDLPPPGHNQPQQ